MRRVRGAVATGVVVLALLLAGCSGGGGGLGDSDLTPVPTPDVDTGGGTPEPPAVTAAPPSSAETDQGAAFLAGVADSRFPVRSATTANGAFGVTYVSTDSTLTRDAYLLGLAYGGTVNRTWRNETTWSATRLDGLAVRADGGALARVRIPAYWPLQYFEGTISARTFGDRIRATLERTDSDGRFPEGGSRVTDFYTAADRTAVDVAGASVRNRTVFVTVRAPTGDRAQLRSALAELVTAYGDASTDWETTALEVSVRDRDGDFYGWYRADADVAAAVAAGERDLTLSDRRFVANEGRLVGST